MVKITRFLLLFALTVLGVASCSPSSGGMTPVLPTPAMTDTPPHPTLTLEPSITEGFPLPSITPTPLLETPTDIQLPFVNEATIQSEICNPNRVSDIQLSISAAQGLSEDEIVEQLMELWLLYYTNPQTPGRCRIDGYKIDKVYYDERLQYAIIDPKGDFMRTVLFSIKLVQIPNDWESWEGGGAPIDQQNWLHLGALVAVFRYPSGYTMQWAGP